LNLVVGTLIDNLLTIDSIKLVIVTVNNQLAHIKQFKPIVMSLHNKYVDPTNRILVKEKVVVTVDSR